MERSLAVGVLVFIGGFGVAAGESRPERDPHVDVLKTRASACRLRPGEICLAAGDARTHVLPSETVASAPGAPLVSAPAWRLARAADANGKGKNKGVTDEDAWTISIDARLRTAAVAGNALFLLYDSADPNALANQEVTAMYQATVRAGASLGAVLHVSPLEGICPGHTFRLRVVQLVAGAEVVLAETDMTLL